MTQRIHSDDNNQAEKKLQIKTISFSTSRNQHVCTSIL
jgi:hypothetical protein